MSQKTVLFDHEEFLLKSVLLGKRFRDKLHQHKLTDIILLRCNFEVEIYN